MADETVTIIPESGVEPQKDVQQQGNEAVAKAAAGDQTLIDLGNKIARNEASDSDIVDFRIHLAEVKSNIMQDPNLDEEGKNIRSNAMRKIENGVLGYT